VDVELLIFGAVAVFILFGIVKAVRAAREVTRSRERQEALFQATFPELQPYFHPEKVLEFVKARRARGGSLAGTRWNSPPGFPAAAVAEFAADAKGEAVRLLDGAGQVLARFVFQEHAEGGVLRMGPGKLTANLTNAAVRYWHPEREFKWSRLKGWRLITSLSDRPMDSNDHGTSWSSSDSSSSTSRAAAVAGAAAVTGAGGAFDGGGSSAAWDDAGAGESRTSY